MQLCHTPENTSFVTVPDLPFLCKIVKFKLFNRYFQVKISFISLIDFDIWLSWFLMTSLFDTDIGAKVSNPLKDLLTH